MNYLLILVLLAILGFGITGYKVGVVRRLVELCGLVGSILLAMKFASVINPHLVGATGLADNHALVICWIVLIVAGLLVTKLLAKGARKLISGTILGWVDRWGGALCGLGIGMLLISVILVAVSQVPGGQTIQATLDEQPVGRFIFRAAPNMYLQVQRWTGGRGDEIWEKALDEAKRHTETAKEKLESSARSET